MSERVTFRANGTAVEADAEPRLSLADLLRERLGLTGTRLGCEQGVCGSCTVLVDGDALRSCLLLAVQVDGAEVTTVEGLRGDPRLAGIPEAFLACRAFQCGFCTPGFQMLVAGLALEGARPGPEELRRRLSANVCRCTGYQRIVDAAGRALAAAREGALG